MSGNRPHSPRRRKFYEIPTVARKEDQPKDVRNGSETGQGAEIASLIRSSLIGSDATFSGPFGVRPIVYCDYVASGTDYDSRDSWILGKLNETCLTFFCRKVTLN